MLLTLKDLRASVMCRNFGHTKLCWPCLVSTVYLFVRNLGIIIIYGSAPNGVTTYRGGAVCMSQ